MSEPLLDTSSLELEVTDDHDKHDDDHEAGALSGSGAGAGAVHAHGTNAAYQVLSTDPFQTQPQPQPQQHQQHEIPPRPTSNTLNGTSTAIDSAAGFGLGLGFDDPQTQAQQQQQPQQQQQRAISTALSSSTSSTSISTPPPGMQNVGLSSNPADALAGLSTAQIDAQFQALPARMRADIEQQLTLMPEQMRQQMRLNMIRQAAIWKQKPDEALLFSVKRHNLPLVKMLIEEFGANPNALDADGNNGLHWSTWYKNAGITEYLLTVRCSVHHANPKMQLPIHWACMGGDLQCIRALVNAGATISAQDKDGYYPVHCCAQHGNTTALDYLKLVGADIQALDYNNRTPLHWAAFKNELITTTWLVQQGLELSAKDTGGRTPLHWAASQNNQEIVSYLIGEMETTGEMDLLKLKDDTDMTPLELAEKKESRAVAKYLHDVEKRESSQFWRIWQKAFCMTNKKTSRALQSGRNISIWLGLITAWSLFDHAVWVYGRTPSVTTAAHWAVFIGCACMVMLWLKTHLTDPGFLPKSGAGITNRDTPANAVISVRPDDDEKSGMLSADSLDEGVTIASLTYEQCLEKGLADAICVTCRITRPLRAKHCRHCDRCVTRFDHHCPWVNTCVGGGNHFWFVWFLIFCIWVMILYVAVHIKYLQEPDNKGDVWRYFVEIPVLGHHIFMIIYVLLLLSQQTTMIFSNLTTNEKINSYRYAYLRSALGDFHNPFDQGALGNCLSFCWLKKEKQVPHLQQYYSQPQMSHMGMGAAGGHGHSHGGGHGGHGGHGGGGHGHSHGGGGGHGHSH